MTNRIKRGEIVGGLVGFLVLVCGLACVWPTVLADQSDGRTDVEITWLDNETFQIDRAVYYGCIAETWDASLADEYWNGHWEASCRWINPPCGVVFHLCPVGEVGGVCQPELLPGQLMLFAFMGGDIPCVGEENHDQPN